MCVCVCVHACVCIFVHLHVCVFVCVRVSYVRMQSACVSLSMRINQAVSEALVQIKLLRKNCVNLLEKKDWGMLFHTPSLSAIRSVSEQIN